MGGTRFWAALGIWAPIAAATTVACLFVNLAVQQSFRTSADDPQLQFAEDGAALLATGERPDSVAAGKEPLEFERGNASPVDIAQSLAPWVAVYGSDGMPVASNGRLHGALPELPPGIFDYVRDNGQDRVTWRPEPGLRIALIVRRVDGNKPLFIASGRSLRETERRVDSLNLMTLLAWAAALLGSFLAAALFNSGFRRSASDPDRGTEAA